MRKRFRVHIGTSLGPTGDMVGEFNSRDEARKLARKIVCERNSWAYVLDTDAGHDDYYSPDGGSGEQC